MFNKNIVKKSIIEDEKLEIEYEWKNGYVLLNTKTEKYEAGNSYKEEDRTYQLYSDLGKLFYEQFPIKDKNVFEVKGLIERAKTSYFPYPCMRLYTSVNQIIIQKQLSWGDMKVAMCLQFPMIESKEEYEEAQNTGYFEFSRRKFVEKAIELGHSKTFAMVVHPRENQKDKNVYDKMIALNEEGISKDMIAYLLLK